MDGLKRRLTDSVQLRLSLSLSLVILVIALVTGVVSYLSSFNESLQMQDKALRQVAVLFERQHMALSYPRVNTAIPDDDEESRVIVQYLADGQNAPAASEAGVPIPLPPSLPDGLSTRVVGGEPFRVLVKTLGTGERIAVAQEIDSRDRDARESAWHSLLPFAILFPALLLVVADLVRRLFRPIATLAREIDERGEQELHPVDLAHVPFEVTPFVLAINRLLARVVQAREVERQFVANAAHELRSPLAALSLQAERLAAAPMSAVAQERFMTLQGGIERARNLVHQLLALAGAQAGAPAVNEPVSVKAVYRRVLEDLLPLAEIKNIDIGVVGEQDCLVMISEIDLLTLVKNLADNAIRYTPAGGRVDLAVYPQNGGALLEVIDTGPGILGEHLERIFEPFYRVLGSNEEGSGLGLSIVRAIAQRNGARVAVDNVGAPAERGLRVQVWLPPHR